MSILTILQFPDPRLRQKAAPVVLVDDNIRTLVDDMFETMYSAPGIGLAAIQVDILKRVIVIDISENKSDPKCFINPEIIAHDGSEKIDEGCLSVPGIYEPVSRAKNITVHYLDQGGNKQELTVDGLLSVCIQHEMDHLDGKLFVDYLSEMKRNRIRKKMEKIRQHTM